ncbi:MAG: hypothetical protein KDC12_00045 [Flavobacteriales bacterium]|nr:hypothetical protein [Flavobacteriales bacterium]
MQRKIFGFLCLLMITAAITSCSVFRKKNRCNTCPTWRDEVEVVDPAVVEE